MNTLQTTQQLLAQITQTGSQHLTNALGDVLNQLQGQLQGGLNDLVGLLNGQLGNLIGGLTGLLGKRAIHIQEIIQQVQSLNLPALFQNLQSQIQGTLSNFIQQGLQLLTSLNKPQARSALFTAAAQAKGDITNAFNSLLAEALSHLQSIATSLANVGLASVLGALQGKRAIFSGLGDIFNTLTSTVGQHIDNISQTFSQVGQQLLSAVVPHLSDLQDQMTGHILNAAQSLLGTLSNISSTLQGKRGIFDDLLSSVTQALGSLGSSLQQTGTQLVGAVLPHLQDLQDQLINHGLNAAQSLLGTLAGISGTLSG